MSRRELLRLLGLGGAALALSPLMARAAGVSLAGDEPNFYRFKIGEIEAVALFDGNIVSPLSKMAWWADVPNDKVATVLQSAFVSPDEIRLAITVLLLRLGNDLVMIDSGCGPLFGDTGGRLVESLHSIGIAPDQITGVVVSHMHGDHFGGLLDGEMKPVFPNAKIYLNEIEHAFWSEKTPDLGAVRMPEAGKAFALKNAHSYLEALKDHWTLVKSGQKLFDSLEIIAAPGHTPGHSAVLVSSGNTALLHVADAVHHHAVSFEHPDWKFVADTQPDVAVKTRQALLDRAATQRLLLYGAHLPFPAIGHVRKGEGHFEYVIEPWGAV